MLAWPTAGTGTVVEAADVLLARQLLQEADSLLASCPTSMEQDQELLAAGAMEERLRAAVVYRYERKRLAHECRHLLRLYLEPAGRKGAEAGAGAGPGGKA